jgi:hypothetical protein
MQPFLSHTRASAAGHRSGGGVIVVVIALLTSLMFLGIVFYEFSSQERNAAEAGSRSRERDDQVDLPYGDIGDDALEQLLVGAPFDARISALWQNDPMLQDLLGRFAWNGAPVDTAPHTGRGISVWATGDFDGNGYPDASTGAEIQFDYYGDGTGIVDGDGFVINFSPPAYNWDPSGPFISADGVFASSQASTIDRDQFMELDQGYTYPDINSPWLAFDALVGGERVIKPSFMFPQYFPVRRNSGTFSGLSTDPITVAQVLHPHAEHVVALPTDLDGDGTADPVYRFLSAMTPAQSGDTSRIIPPFPFEVDADNDGILGEMGVWTNSDSYDLPVDADGDGTKDSVRVDIGHAIIDLPGGRQVVPLVAFKIIELDGLFDLNSQGNPAVQIAASNAGALLDPFGTFHSAPQFLHYSGWGASPSEINPLVGLLGDPTSLGGPGTPEWERATLPHQGMYGLGGNSGMTFNRLQMANTEFAMLNYGVFQFYIDGTGALALASSDPNDHHIGRWGQDNGVVSANLLFDFLSETSGTAPSAGVLNLDDDGDDNDNSNNGAALNGDYPALENADGGDGGRPLAENSATMAGATPPRPATRPVATPPVVHPLNPTALLNDLQASASSLGAIPVLASDGSSPMVYKQYDPAGLPQSQGGATVHGVSSYDLALAGFLQSPGYDGLLNEPDEMILEPSLLNGYDAPFGFEELAGLHWSENDWDLYGHTSRLRQLMPFNFDWSTTPVPAWYIRSQYSVNNVDRLEFGHHVFQDAANDRTWEFNAALMDIDTDGDTLPDTTIFGFPPEYAGASNQIWYQVNSGAGIDPIDPFRPEVRRLLTIPVASQNGSRPYFPQHRLNINRILADDEASSGGPAAFDSNGNPQYRQLVPHPAEGNAADQIAPGAAVPDMVHKHDPAIDPLPYAWTDINAPPIDPIAQEWWARYDRQRLARDIYVLLYTVGAPDTLDPTTTPYATGDTNSNGIDDMVEAMAQFAVNFVDQVDRDGVITRFEYDPDLTNGWDVGWVGGDPPPSIAYGVEHQQLVFSEVMYIQNDIDTTDHNTTLHDDRNDTHRWLHVELRNASPFPVEMREETWRLAREDATGTVVAAVDFGNGATFRTVNAGENILISMHDGTVANGAGEIICSDFYADYTGGTELESILPDNGAPIVDNDQDPEPTADIDLCDPLRAAPNGHDSYFVNPVTLPMAGGSTLVAPVPGGGPANETFDLVLMRGRKTDTGGLANIDWIEVDRFQVESTDAEFGTAFAPPGDAQADNDMALSNLNSRERRQPFDGRIEDNPATTPPRNHSMVTGANKHAANGYWLDASNALTSPLYPNFTCWQPHFDRDYASVMELLSLPLFGADDVVSQLYNNPAPPDAPRLDYAFAAGLRIMNPDGSTANPNSPTTTDPMWVGNRWFRLLEFLEVPERTHDSLAERLQYLRRTYGRMNLNAIRHPHVLAGLVDDTYHLDVTAADATQDLLDPLARDWYDELLVSRDGIDHITSLPLPGMPQSRPFRNLSHINSVAPDQSEQDTILRSTGSAAASPTLQFFNLFEARAQADIDPDTTDSTYFDEVDYHTRNRLLGKIHNLTTNRSHLFACWIAVEFFEAHQIPVDTDGDGDPDSDGDGVPEALATQVGGLAGDLPMRRLFCVIDRSRLEEAYDPTTGRFDFRQLIVYKRWID